MSSEGVPPLVSVVTPLYTSAAHIAGVLEGLRARTFADWEVVLVDNSSTDDTELHVAPFLADSRFRYLERQLAVVDTHHLDIVCSDATVVTPDARFAFSDWLLYGGRKA